MESDAKEEPVGLPHMSGDELEFFKGALASADKSWYLEYGTGGSTLLAAQMGFDYITAVDSDLKWLRRVRASSEVRQHAETKTALIYHADIGPVKDWGKPSDESGMRRWPSYILKPWYRPPSKRNLPSVIFIDGRFRVACCLFVALKLLLATKRSFPLILIHDIDVNRPYYDAIFKYYKKVEVVGTLCKISLRRSVNRDELLVDLCVKLLNPA